MLHYVLKGEPQAIAGRGCDKLRDRVRVRRRDSYPFFKEMIARFEGQPEIKDGQPRSLAFISSVSRLRSANGHRT